MRQEEKQLLKEQGEKIDRLLLIVAGDEKLQIKGLAQRQADDEEWQKQIILEVKQVQDKQMEMHKIMMEQTSSIEEHDRRIKIVERFYNIVDQLSKVKKKTVRWFIAIAAFITGLITFWERISQYIHK